MKKVNLLLLLVFTTYLITACKNKESANVQISIHGAGLKKSKVSAFTRDMISLEPVVLAEATLDSSGNAVLEFTADKPAFRFVKVGELEISAFSVPGDKFDIVLDSLEKPEGIRFEGDEANVNDYIVKCRAERLKHDKLDDKYYFQLEPNEFLSLKNSLQTNLKKLHDHLVKNTDLDPEIAAVMKTQQEFIMTNFVYNYVRPKYADGLAVPESIKNIIDNIPDDSLALKYGMIDYSFVADAYLEYKIYVPLYNEERGDISADSAYALRADMAYKKIEKSAYPDFLKEFLLAKNVNTCLVLDGITPQVDAVYQKFLKSSKNEQYLTSLRKSYKKWLDIGPGQPAPDFSGNTPDGKVISLSDLKGRVVYVDVWATWCGPCKTELPFSKKLQQTFEGNNEVAFLYLSIDESIPDWKQMLEKDKTFRGIHINQQQHQQPGAIWEKYLMTGIPRYILIDQDGKIVQSNASRPSSGKVADEINELLRRKGMAAK